MIVKFSSLITKTFITIKTPETSTISYSTPGGPYAALAGHDGSRALATMSLDESAIKPEWDELDDLTPFQMDALNDWVMTFQTKYTEVELEMMIYLHVGYFPSVYLPIFSLLGQITTRENRT